jgi:hypothetical protein
MLVALNGKGLEPPLPDVPAAVVVPVIPPDMAGEQPLHPAPQVAVAVRPQDQMEMVGHEAPTDDPHRQPLARRLEQADERLEILVLVKDLGPTVATVEQMVAPVRSGSSRGSWHAPKQSRPASAVKKK